MLAAVIAHSDETDFLIRNVDHHLAIGFDYIFVSLQRPLPEADAHVAKRWADDPRVRVEPVESYSPDTFNYFTAAKQAVVDWVDPEWIAFIDSDEFWLPRTGSIKDTRKLDNARLLKVRRYFSPVIADAAPVAMPYPDLYDAPVMPDPPAKLMVRPSIVSRVDSGAHAMTTTRRFVRRIKARDLLIVHLSFTTEERFHNKLSKIRERMAQWGGTFRADQALHWKHWLQVADTGGNPWDEVAPLYTEQQVARGVADGTMATASQRLARSGDR